MRYNLNIYYKDLKLTKKAVENKNKCHWRGKLVTMQGHSRSGIKSEM